MSSSTVRSRRPPPGSLLNIVFACPSSDIRTRDQPNVACRVSLTIFTFLYTWYNSCFMRCPQMPFSCLPSCIVRSTSRGFNHRLQTTRPQLGPELVKKSYSQLQDVFHLAGNIIITKKHKFFDYFKVYITQHHFANNITTETTLSTGDNVLCFAGIKGKSNPRCLSFKRLVRLSY